MLKTLFDWSNDWKGMSNVLVLIYGTYIYTHTYAYIQYMVEFVGQTREGSHLLALSLWFVDFAVQSLSCLTLCNTWSAACKASLSFIIYQNLLKLMSIAIQLSHPLPPPSPPLLFPSIRLFSNELALPIRWPKYWRFSFSISHSMNIQDWFPFRLTVLISLLS